MVLILGLRVHNLRYDTAISPALISFRRWLILVLDQVVDFVIASVFSQREVFQGRPEDKHLLSHGYRRASRGILCTIPNVESYYPNKNVRMLKQSPWPEVLALLGGNGDEIMLKLLLDCGLFVAVDAKKGIYCQISGGLLAEWRCVSGCLPSI